MPSFETSVVINYISRRTPQQRSVGLKALLREFQVRGWLDEAIAIALEIKGEAIVQGRQR